MNALLLAVAVAATIAPPQDPPEGMMLTPPPELDALDWMMGDFDFNMEMPMPGEDEGVPVPGTSSTHKTMGGMWLETRHAADFGGMKMTGMQLMSYDMEAKEYVSYWFDSLGPGSLEMRGKLKGQTLVMESKMASFPGMPGKSAYRATYSMKGRGKVFFRLETDTGTGWGVMVEGMMTRQ